MTEAHDPLIAGLAARAGQLADAATDLKNAYRFSRQLKVILAIGVIVIGLNACTTLLNLWALAAIRSCTTPSGDCYQRGQQQQATAVAEVVSRNVEAFIVVQECGRVTHTDTDLEACVAHRLPR